MVTPRARDMSFDPFRGRGSLPWVFVKICGITRPADAIAAVDAGADAIGLNFVSSSRRFIDVATAREIAAVVPDHVMSVGVFKEHRASEILEIAKALDLDSAQLHGDSPGVTSSDAIGVHTLINVVTVEGPSVRDIGDDGEDIVMLDAPSAGGGVPFDWRAVGNLVTKHKILLAGGLRPDNVAEAIRVAKPWGVDVASGVGTEPGHKDPDAIARFVATARDAADLLAEP